MALRVARYRASCENATARHPPSTSQSNSVFTGTLLQHTTLTHIQISDMKLSYKYQQLIHFCDLHAFFCTVPDDSHNIIIVIHFYSAK